MLNRIRVKNFKSFKDLDYSCAKLNLLTGVNGAGKSSFVQLLLLLKAISAKGLSDKPINAKGIGFHGKFADLKYCYANDDDDIEVEVDFTVRELLEENEDGSYTASAHILEYLLPIDEKQAEYRSKRKTFSLVIRPYQENSFAIIHPIFREKFINSLEFADLVAFLNEHGGRDAIEERVVKNPSASPNDYEIFEIMHSKLRNVNELRKKVYSEIEADVKEQKELFEEIWKNMRMVSAFRIKPREVHDAGYVAGRFNPEGDDAVEYLCLAGHRFFISPNNPMRHQSTKSEEKSCLIDQINAWLGEVSPGATICIKSDNVGDLQKFVESVDFGEGDLRRTFKPQNVGFGISYILPVLVTLLTAQPEDIVIIENPEAHLHPRGQSEIGRLIACAAARGAQLFVETHSDHVINGVRVAIKEGLIKPEDAKVAFFERSKHTTSSEDGKGFVEAYTSERDIMIDKNGALSEYPTDFLDEWNNQLMELM